MKNRQIPGIPRVFMTTLAVILNHFNLKEPQSHMDLMAFIWIGPHILKSFNNVVILITVTMAYHKSL